MVAHGKAQVAGWRISEPTSMLKLVEWTTNADDGGISFRSVRDERSGYGCRLV